MDIGTIIGIGVGLTAVTVGIILGGVGIGPYISIDSIFITIIGSFGAVIVANPMRRMMDMGKYLRVIFRTNVWNEEDIIAQLVSFSDRARKEGLLALEDNLDSVEDMFMHKGIELVVDGTDPDIIKTILYAELAQLQERHEAGIKVMEDWAKIAPAFGLIGTLIGLIAVLGQIGGDTASIGRGMQTALVTTLYGSFFANLFLLPFKSKMTDRNVEETRVKEIIIEGVISIQSGDNPRILLEKLLSYIPPSNRESIREESGVD